METLLKAKEIYPVAFCREGDITVSIIDVHPAPKTIDILALTPAILNRQVGSLLAKMKSGCTVRLLTAKGLAALIWGRERKSFFVKFDQLAQFVESTAREDVADLFLAREIDWAPSVGMIIINGREPDGAALISIHTPDPTVSRNDKACLELSAATFPKFFEYFATQFRSLWSRAQAVEVTDDRGRWERLRASVSAESRALLKVVSDNSPEVKDFGFVIALAEEFRYFRRVMGEMVPEQDPANGQWYYTFECGGRRCVAVVLGKMGKTIAAQMVERLTHRFSIGTVVSIGIAGGVGKDARVGDVVVASQVDDYLHRSKAALGMGPAKPRDIIAASASAASPIPGEGTSPLTPPGRPGAGPPEDFELRMGGSVFPTTYSLVSDILHVEFTRPDLFKAWQEECTGRARGLLGDKFQDAQRHRAVRTVPDLHADDAHIASGDVVAAARPFIKWVQARDRNVVAVEMEAVGVISAAHAHLLPVRTLVVRGISDPSDDSKEELEALFEDRLREMAMVNATLLMKALLEGKVLPSI
jgi:nucleoside phosphorylase